MILRKETETKKYINFNTNNEFINIRMNDTP